jgi:hypothetical protein
MVIRYVDGKDRGWIREWGDESSVGNLNFLLMSLFVTQQLTYSMTKPSQSNAFDHDAMKVPLVLLPAPFEG